MTPMTSGFAEALNALLDNVGKDFRNRLEEEDVRWWNEHPTELALALLSVSKVRRRPPVPLHRDFKYPLLLGPESDPTEREVAELRKITDEVEATVRGFASDA